MKNPIYAIRDRHTGYMQPIVDVNDETASRRFKRTVNNPNTEINFSPKDFSLYRLGVFDSDTGAITPLPAPELVIDAFSCVEMESDADEV